MENEFYKYEIQDNEVCILECKQAGIVKLPESVDGCPVTSISMGVLQSDDERNSPTKVIIPASIKEIRPLSDGKMFYSSNRADVEVSADNKYFVCKDDVLYNKNMTELIYCPSNKVTESGIFNVPSTVKVIKKGAFQDSLFAEINLPYGLKSIEAMAFQRSKKMIETYIPDSVVDVGQAAFAECTSMERVRISSSLFKIPRHTFAECTSMTSVTNLENVKNVENGVFDGCRSLKEITFGIDTKIGELVLNRCDSLQRVKLPPSYDTKDKQAPIFACTNFDNIEISFVMGNEKLMRNNYLIGMGYLYGTEGFEKDVDRGLAFIKAASNLGYVEATEKLADVYEYGIGVDTDYDKAKEYREKAITQTEQQKRGINKSGSDSSIVSSYVGINPDNTLGSASKSNPNNKKRKM